MKGWLYILDNKAMPDLLKIGMTTRTPDERARELFLGNTGVAEPFNVIYSVEVSDTREAEKEIHKLLYAYRYNSGREFFLVDKNLAMKLLDIAASRFSINSELYNNESSDNALTVSASKDNSMQNHKRQISRKKRKLDAIRAKNLIREKELASKIGNTDNKISYPLSHAEASRLEAEKREEKSRNKRRRKR